MLYLLRQAVKLTAYIRYYGFIMTAEIQFTSFCSTVSSSTNTEICPTALNDKCFYQSETVRRQQSDMCFSETSHRLTTYSASDLTSSFTSGPRLTLDKACPVEFNESMKLSNSRSNSPAIAWSFAPAMKSSS